MHLDEVTIHKIRSFLAYFILEMMGTAVLVIGINFHNGNLIVIPIALFCGAMIAGKVTGAHFNMNVTLGIYVIDGKYWQQKNTVIAMVLG